MIFKKKKKSTPLLKILEEAYKRYGNNEKISYEEFVIMLTTNDELWFSHEGTEYRIDHGVPCGVSIAITQYSENKVVFQSSENFASIIELLVNFRIKGKSIKEIWNEVSF